MSDYPTSATPIRTYGLREVCIVNGRRFSRRKGTLEWVESEGDKPSPPPEDSNSKALYLSLVHQEQSAGEPLHWSLFVHHENEPGAVYQVKGDAENMRYQPSTRDIDITISMSFLALYQLAVITEEQAIVVKEVAESELPPQALNRQSVTENCQGWTVRVISKLVAMGIVENAKLEMVRQMVQPV